MFKRKKSGAQRTGYRCSFCGKGQAQVEWLIAGPGGVYICDECVALCQEIIQEQHDALQQKPAEVIKLETEPAVLCSACGTPCSATHHYCFNCGQKLSGEM